jgi:hypothetical protein
MELVEVWVVLGGGLQQGERAAMVEARASVHAEQEASERETATAMDFMEPVATTLDPVVPSERGPVHRCGHNVAQDGTARSRLVTA